MPTKHANKLKQQAERFKKKTFGVEKSSELLEKEKSQDKGNEPKTTILL